MAMRAAESLFEMPGIERGRNRPALPAVALILLVLCLAVSPRLALGQDVNALADQVQRLQRQLDDLQQQVGGGGPGGSATGTVASGPLAAQLEIRLQQLESQMRDLTGKVEELTYQQNQLNDRLDKMAKDTDFRLQSLEGGAPAGGRPAPGVAEGTGAAAGSATAEAGGAAAPAGQGTSQGQGQGQVLGTLSSADIAKAQAADANRPQTASTGNQATTGGALPAGTPEAQYQYAFGLLREAKYPEAETALKSFVAAHPKSDLAGNAQFWLGETYYVRKDYKNAAVAFAETYQKYPGNPKAPDSLIKLAMSLSALGNKSDACKAFAQFNRQYPNAATNLQQRAKTESARAHCG